MGAMKKLRIASRLAPAPRMTLWVPGLVSIGLCLVWLALWSVFG